jgi:hypothetical protein
VNLGEGRGRAERFLSEIGSDLPTILDQDRVAGEAWGVRGLPMAFLVDAAGRVRWWVFGACDWNEGAAAAALEELVKAP